MYTRQKKKLLIRLSLDKLRRKSLWMGQNVRLLHIFFSISWIILHTYSLANNTENIPNSRRSFLKSSSNGKWSGDAISVVESVARSRKKKVGCKIDWPYLHFYVSLGFGRLWLWSNPSTSQLAFQTFLLLLSLSLTHIIYGKLSVKGEKYI